LILDLTISDLTIILSLTIFSLLTDFLLNKITRFNNILAEVITQINNILAEAITQINNIFCILVLLETYPELNAMSCVKDPTVSRDNLLYSFTVVCQNRKPMCSRGH